MSRRGKQPPPPQVAEDEEDEETGEEEEDGLPDTPGEVRLDKWLWAARCFKSRTAATEACDGGHVKVNASNARPARPVRLGDRIEVQTAEVKRILVVKALGSRRGSAAVAATLFTDLTPPPPPREPVVARWGRGEGRPTKRDRRTLDRIKGW